MFVQSNVYKLPLEKYMQEVEECFKPSEEGSFGRAFKRSSRRELSTQFEKEIDQCMKGITVCDFPWHLKIGLSNFGYNLQTYFSCSSSPPATPDIFKLNNDLKSWSVILMLTTWQIGIGKIAPSLSFQQISSFALKNEKTHREDLSVTITSPITLSVFRTAKWKKSAP